MMTDRRATIGDKKKPSNASAVDEFEIARAEREI
jgi:hypothetical protein